MLWYRWYCALAMVASATSADAYAKGDEVTLFANKVGPFANPNEVYAYYSLPYCAPSGITTRREDLGALLIRA